MRNIALVVEYDGTDFHGFAAQADVPTIQGALTQALEKILNETIVVQGAGRTDAGAHSVGQTINFATERDIPVKRLVLALNRILPAGIAIRTGRMVQDDFNARFSAVSRTYEYRILNRSRPSPFLSRYALFEPRPLNWERMNIAAQSLIGEHDFTAFTLEPVGSRHFKRTIFSAGVRRVNTTIKFRIVGTAFLQGMVRLITGKLIEIGLDKAPVDAIKQMLDNPNGKRATWVVPPQGLCLIKVAYDR